MKFILSWLIMLLFCMSEIHSKSVVSPDADAIQSENAEYVDLNEFCKSNPCRKDVHFNLRTEKGKIDERTPYYWPVIQGDKVSLLAGEKILVVSKLDGNQIKNFEIVKESNNAISFDLKQNKDDFGMMLVIKNPYDYHIKVSIDLIDFQGNLHETSSCSIIAGGSIFEMWPHPIPEMLISNIRKYDDSKGMSCEY